MRFPRFTTVAAALALGLTLAGTATTASAGGCGPSYTVGYGDTLARIASYCGVSVRSIMAANPYIYNPNVIRVGQVINIPQGGGYGYQQPPKYKYNSYQGGSYGYSAYKIRYGSHRGYRGSYGGHRGGYGYGHRSGYGSHSGYRGGSYHTPRTSYHGGSGYGGYTVNYNAYQGYGY